MIVDDDDANAMVRTIHVAKIDDTLAGCRAAVAVRCQIRAECRAILARSPLCSLLRSNANQRLEISRKVKYTGERVDGWQKASTRKSAHLDVERKGEISVVDQECPLGRRRDRLARLVRFMLGDSDQPRQRSALPRGCRYYAHANSTQATQ